MVFRRHFRGVSLIFLRQFQVVDAYAHPYTSPDVKAYRETGLAGSVAAVLGDGVYLSKGWASGPEYSNTMRQPKKGGIVGPWPLVLGFKTTVRHWAVELAEMKKRIGIEHIGIGTDDGGRLPQTVKGYKGISSPGNLVEPLSDAEFSRDDIAAVLGGNFLRVLKTCIG